jgi:hypothetical protein
MMAQLLATVAMFIVLISTARAQSSDEQAKAIDLITSTADKICNVVTDKGTANSSEVKGDISAQLSGLASKLAEAGFKGSGSITNESYQGPLRQDLAKLLSDNSTCKLQVFTTLQAKLLLSPQTQPQTSSQASDPLYGRWIRVSSGDSLQITPDLGAFLSFGPPAGMHVNGTARISHCTIGGGNVCLEGAAFGCSFSYSISAGVLNFQYRGVVDTRYGTNDCQAIIGDYRKQE